MTRVTTRETSDYQAGLKDGKLLYQHCHRCDALVWHPRHVCPECWEGSLEWRESARLGTIYTFTTVHVGPTAEWSARVPYTMAMVELDEGFIVMAHVAEADAGSVAIGTQVELVVGGDIPLLAHRRSETTGGLR